MMGPLVAHQSGDVAGAFPGAPDNSLFKVLHGFPGYAILIFKKKNALSR
jgi:hypothetical protein